MSPDNPWFLITREEIELIRNGLEGIENTPADRNRVQEKLAVVNRVRGRMA